MGLLAAAVLLVVLFAYVFWPTHGSFLQRARTRLDFLEERREAVMGNLRDLNFEHHAGKYPEDDYLTQREMLEQEAETIVAEMDAIGEQTLRTAP